MITRARAKELLESFGKKRLLVVGDLMLDRYVYGKVDRISPEAPVPVVRVAEEDSRPGGAANVAQNIASLGGQAVVAGIIGSDIDGDELAKALSGSGILTDGMVTVKSSRTTVKTRFLAERQQVVRVDRESDGVFDKSVFDELCSSVQKLIEDVDGVIVEDYGKGVVSQALLDSVIESAGKVSVPVALDPKYGHDLAVSGVRLATPNYREACSAAGVPEVVITDDGNSKAGLLKAGEFLVKNWNTEMLLVTLGPRGMCLLGRDGDPEFIPTKAREVFDVSGAGDTVISAAALALVSGADNRDAASMANYAAGIVVGKVGTATCSPEELLANIE